MVNPKTIQHRLQKYVHSVCKQDLFYSISENGLQQRVERWTFLSPFLATGILDNFKIKILQEILFKSLSKETKIRYILISNFLHAYEFLWNISALAHVSLKSTKYSKNWISLDSQFLRQWTQQLMTGKYSVILFST